MASGPRHTFVSAITDDPVAEAAGMVLPSHWNDGHEGVSFLSSRKASADTPDDEFDASTLDAKWTAVAGSLSTVNLWEVGNVAKYDFTTREGSMLVQVGSAATQQVLLRQDFTLPDGASIVAAISPAMHVAALTGDELQIGISLNNDDSGFAAGSAQYTFYAVEMDTIPDIQTLHAGSTGGQAGVTVAATLFNALGRTVFLRLSRAGLFYGSYYSFDGLAWMPIGGTSFASAFTNLWFFARNAAATGTPVPIHSVAWIRQGTNDVDPWPWT